MNRQKFFSMIGRRDRPNKYRAKKVQDVVDGKIVWFASKLEHRRWKTLQWMLTARLISELRRQVPFKCEVNGVLVCTYIADFTYVRKSDGKFIVEDAKGVDRRGRFRTTDLYRFKKRLVQALWGVEIQEVTA